MSDLRTPSSNVHRAARRLDQYARGDLLPALLARVGPTMTDRPPIPSSLWARILAFLKTGATGQIVLDVHQGTVKGVTLNERIRDDEPAAKLPERQPDRC